jgi:hypothetical protein
VKPRRVVITDEYTVIYDGPAPPPREILDKVHRDIAEGLLRRIAVEPET